MDDSELHGSLRKLQEWLTRLEREQELLGGRSSGSVQLLLGEGSAVGRADAAHWAAVYGDLISFKENLISAMRERAQGEQPGLAVELLKDARRLQPELERLHVHRQFWETQGRGGSPAEDPSARPERPD